jgi:uncharacterized lipoprotein YbaY
MRPTTSTRYYSIGSRMSEPLVTGEILLPAHSAIPASAVAYVHLLNTSLADAPATIVAEQVINDVAAKIAGGGRIKFALYGEIQDPRASYSVSVHIDVDMDGRVSVGDYINVQSYPVVTFGYPDHIEVKTAMVK